MTFSTSDDLNNERCLRQDNQIGWLELQQKFYQLAAGGARGLGSFLFVHFPVLHHELNILERRYIFQRIG